MDPSGPSNWFHGSSPMYYWNQQTDERTVRPFLKDKPLKSESGPSSLGLLDIPRTYQYQKYILPEHLSKSYNIKRVTRWKMTFYIRFSIILFNWILTTICPFCYIPHKSIKIVIRKQGNTAERGNLVFFCK